jgi:hypothetical protein
MTGTDWDDATPSGGASGTWGSSKLTLTCVSGSAGTCGAEQSDYTQSGEYYDVAIRLRVLSGDNSSNTRMILVVGVDSTHCSSLALFSDGSFETGHTNSSYTYWNVASTISGINNSVRTGGQLWIRSHRSALGIAWYWGVGSGGNLPTQWNLVYSSIEREVAGALSTAQAGMYVSNGRFVGIYGITLSGMDFSFEVLSIVTALPGALGGS